MRHKSHANSSSFTMTRYGCLDQLLLVFLRLLMLSTQEALLSYAQTLEDARLDLVLDNAGFEVRTPSMRLKETQIHR